MNRSSSCCLRVNMFGPDFSPAPAAILKQSTNSVAVLEVFLNIIVEKKISAVERPVRLDEAVEPDDPAALAGTGRGRMGRAHEQGVGTGKNAEHRGILHREGSR